MKAIAFFSGVGGIELGFKQAGIETLWANEIDTNASKTYLENHSNPLLTKDIYELNISDIPDAEILLAGFPCQAFSIAGYRKGFEDERGNVFFKLAQIIKKKKPKVVFLENVKNIVSHDNGNTFRVISETLSNYGYFVKLLILNSSNYGNIPQNRERAYIIGFLDKKVYDKFQEPEKLLLNKKIRNCLIKDKDISAKYYYNKNNFKHYDTLDEEITDYNSIYQWRRVYVRKNKSKLCPTLTANMGTGGHNVPIVKTKKGIRKLTPKECFNFQGFPENFILPNISDAQLYKQAGNSVVVPVIKRLAENIKTAITDSKK